MFRNLEPNLEAFLGDRRITENGVHFAPGTELVFRCKDIGKYSLIGSVRRRCMYGDWDGIKPSCYGLSQENDYARERYISTPFLDSGGRLELCSSDSHSR